MATINTNIKLNTAILKNLDKEKEIALIKTAEALKTEIIQAEVMPRDIGTLQNESTAVDDSNATNGSVSIVSNTPYARRLYFHPEYNFDRTKNSNAGGRWFDNYMDGNFVTDAFIRIYGGSFKL